MKYKRILLLRLECAFNEKATHNRQFFPPLNLKYIQTLLVNKGYDVKIVDCWLEPLSYHNLIKTILEWPTDILIISTVNYNFALSKELVSEIKKNNKRIISVAVGSDVTVCPERYINSDYIFDVGIRGEPEEEALNLINKLNAPGDTGSIIYEYAQKIKEDPVTVKNLNLLPFPVYTKQELKKYIMFYPLPLAKKIRWGFILSSRGCPYLCKFCSFYIRKSFGKEARFRSPKSVVDEVESLINSGVNMISFEDDDFTLDRSHVFSICSEIKNRKANIRWSCHARLDEIDFSLLQEMKSAGCVLLIIGIESGSPRVHSFLNKYKNYEELLERSYGIFRMIKSLNMHTHVLFILGNPGEEIKDLNETFKLAKILSPDTIQLHFFTPYQDSVFFAEFKEKINSNLLTQMYHFQPPFINLSNIPAADLKEKYFLFYKYFYFNLYSMLKHIRRYFFFYVFNIRIFKKTITMLIALRKQGKKWPSPI